MQAHLDNRCAGYAERSSLKPEVPAVQEGPSEAEEPFAKKPRTPIALLGHFDRALTSSEQRRSVHLLALACVKTATPFHPLESEEFRAFFASLRKDFAPPSRHTLQREIEEIYLETKAKVEARLTAECAVYLAVDGWEDAHKCPVLGVSALIVNAKPILLAFDREWQRETHDVLRDRLKEVLEELQKLGLKVEGIITDNAANLQLAISQLNEELGLVTLRCQAHTANLLLQDLLKAAPYKTVLDKLSVMEEFFLKHTLCPYMLHGGAGQCAW